MAYYTIKPNRDKIEPLSEIGNREITTWRGVKNKSLRSKYITDGTIFIDKKHVNDNGLFGKLCDRKSDIDINSDTVNNLIDQLKNEDQQDAEILGQVKASKVGMGTVSAKWIAVVEYGKNNHAIYDASAVDIVQQLLDYSGNLKIGSSKILTWWKYGVPVAGVATWDYYDVEIN